MDAEHQVLNVWICNPWILHGFSLRFIIHLYLPLGNSSAPDLWTSMIGGQAMMILSKVWENPIFW